MSRSRLILNRYAPLAEAGSGGFGTVHVAWDTRIQRKVAIKCISLDDLVLAGAGPAGSGDPQRTVRLGGMEGWETQPIDASDGVEVTGAPDDYAAAMRAYLHVPGLDEARTAALLNDASIVSVYDFEVQGNTAYLIMEYVEGPTLAQLMGEHGEELTLDIVAAVFDGVARALEVAHANQVLHLDIKPDNILIDRKGQVKVTDFGLARLAGAGGFGSAAGGTIGYMPPEQMRGELLDARCDEWALASVTYEMLAGENPFLADTLAHAEEAVEEAELVLPSLCWDDLDEQADDVLFYALDPDREERYDTVADFAEEMRKFLGDPKQGRRQLASLMADAPEDPDEFPARPARPRAARIPLDERVGALPRKIAGRMVAVAGTMLLAGLGLSHLPGASGVGNPLFWGLLALACVLAAIVPSAGALAAYALLAAALIANGALAQGCLLVLAAGSWWWFVGRRGTAQANIALAGPLAGSLGGAAVAPLAAGCALCPLQAAASAAFGAFSCGILATLGSGTMVGWNAPAFWGFSNFGLNARAVAVAMDPGTWICAAGWIVAACACALLASRCARALAAAGAVVAGAVLLIAACAAHGVTTSGASFAPEAGELASILACTAIVAAFAWTFPRHEDGPESGAVERR